MGSLRGGSYEKALEVIQVIIVEGREWDAPDGRRRDCKLLLEESLANTGKLLKTLR